MTETNVSLYKESLRNIEAFLISLNFPVSQIICEGLVAVVNLISDYHEEGVALSPDILLINNDRFFQTLPYQHHIILQTEEIHNDSFSMAVKMCAPLAENGWKMYLQLIDESHLQYGIVNVSLTQMSVSLFKEMARKVIDVHDSYNNFYNETGVVKALANLGTRIPEPAFLVCLDAYLLVYLGNYYGYSRTAAPLAAEELKKISQDRWQVYFSTYINTDDRILNNLETRTQVSRMKSLLESIEMTSLEELPYDNQILFDSIMKNDYEKVKKVSNAMYKKLV